MIWLTAVALCFSFHPALDAGEFEDLGRSDALARVRSLEAPPTVLPYAVAEQFMDWKAGLANIRIKTWTPSGSVIGDVLYLHGFGDRLDNHQVLFSAWTAAGLRVVSFDFPAHGLSTHKKPVLLTVGHLMQMASAVERRTRQDQQRPLILSGWSTGGLVAVRLAQSGAIRPLKGLILFAPAVAPYALVGEHGKVTNATLTRNPLLQERPIVPNTPLSTPALGASIIVQALLSRKPLPAGLPTLIYAAGQDRYVKYAGIMEWARERRAQGALIDGAACPDSFHELDNEPEPLGAEVRRGAAHFAYDAAVGAEPPPVPRLNACRWF